MSNDYPQGQPYPTGPQFGAQGAAAEMEAILERVKDERLRLLRLLKDCETRFGSSGVVPPAEEVARLTGKVRAIDDAVKNRYEQLRHDESVLEKRSYQIDQLRECVQGLADQVASQIDQAKSIEPNLAAARSAVKGEADRVILDARSELAKLGEAMTSKLSEYRNAQDVGQEQLRETRREIEQAFKDIDQRLASAAGAARDEAQKLIDPIFGQLENHATECGLRVQELIRAADDTVREKIEALPDKAREALQPARQTLDEVIEDARAQVASVNDVISDIEGRVNGLNALADGVLQERLDAVMNRAGRSFDEMIAERRTTQLAELETQQNALTHRINEQDATLTRRFEEQMRAFDEREQALSNKLDEVLQDKQAEMMVALDEQADAITKRLLIQQEQRVETMVNERFEKAVAELTERFDTAIGEAGQRAEGTAQQIKDRLAASIDQSRAEAEEAVSRIESQAKESRDRLVESLETSKNDVLDALGDVQKRADEVAGRAEHKAGEIAEHIERSLREQVVGAMSRAEAITEPFKSRLQEALAEHRNQADEYSRTAEQELTDKAKAHWDAFRRDTQAALDKQKKTLDEQAQETIDQTQQLMRDRVQELCASCQSMVDLIDQQLTRKLKAIEPQATQAVESVERQVGERISRMRDNAQSMAQVVEDQLAKRIAELQPNVVTAARDAERELNAHLDRVRGEVERVVAPLRRQVIEELSQIADLGKNVRTGVRPSGDSGATEPPVVDARRLSTPLQEMANRVGKKAAKLISTHHDDASPDNDADRKAA